MHINEEAFRGQDTAVQNMRTNTLLTQPLKRFKTLYVNHRAEVAKARP